MNTTYKYVSADGYDASSFAYSLEFSSFEDLLKGLPEDENGKRISSALKKLDENKLEGCDLSLIVEDIGVLYARCKNPVMNGIVNEVRYVPREEKEECTIL